MQTTTTRRTTWSSIGHATIDRRPQLHLPLAATANPIAAPDETHIEIDATVAVPEAEIHMKPGTGGENLAGAQDGGTLSGGIEIVGIVVAIEMTVGNGTGIGIAVVEMIGMSDGDDEGICISIDNIQAYSKYPVYKKWTRKSIGSIFLLYNTP